MSRSNRPVSAVRVHAPADVAVTIAPTTIPTVSQRAPLFVMGGLQGQTDTEPERPARSVTSAARATAPVVQGLPGGHFQSSPGSLRATRNPSAGSVALNRK